jgi:outer membrane protein assembly factor BamE (lipoprotein component of BamABCDE complex)
MKALRGLGKALKWTLLLGGLLVLVIVIVAVVSLGSASNDSEKSAKQVGPAKYRQAHQGMTKPELRALLGKPESTDETSVSGLNMECWYYGILAQSGSYQFCFSNGKLDSKSRY